MVMPPVGYLQIGKNSATRKHLLARTDVLVDIVCLEAVQGSTQNLVEAGSSSIVCEV